jgi:uncharacterized protein
MDTDHGNCWIYRSSRKEEMYLFLATEDGFEKVPQELLERFGKPQFVLTLKLTQTSKLARAEAAAVTAALQQQGYYLQLPPQLHPHLYFGD